MHTLCDQASAVPGGRFQAQYYTFAKMYQVRHSERLVDGVYQIHIVRVLITNKESWCLFFHGHAG